MTNGIHAIEGPATRRWTNLRWPQFRFVERVSGIPQKVQGFLSGTLVFLLSNEAILLLLSMGLSAQMPHTASVLSQASPGHQEGHIGAIYWLGAASIDLGILMFVLHGQIQLSWLFASFAILINLTYAWRSEWTLLIFGTPQQAQEVLQADFAAIVGVLISSFILPLIVAFYSHRIKHIKHEKPTFKERWPFFNQLLGRFLQVGGKAKEVAQEVVDQVVEVVELPTWLDEVSKNILRAIMQGHGRNRSTIAKFMQCEVSTISRQRIPDMLKAGVIVEGDEGLQIGPKFAAAIDSLR